MASEAHEFVCIDERRHAAVLAVPLARALAAAALGSVALWFRWPYTVAGVFLLCAAAVVALLAVVRWDRTRVLVTSERIVTADGVLSRRTTAVPLAGLPFVEVEQSLFGRLLGYGTIVAGELEIAHVPDAARVHGIAASAEQRRSGRRGGARPANRDPAAA